MKKLITMMAAVALGAFAWASASADAFSGSRTYTVPAEFEVGPTNIVGYADDAKTTWEENQPNPLVYWWATNYNPGAATDYEQPVEVAKATIDNAEVNVLNIETDSATPLLRTFNRVERIVDVYKPAAQTIDDNGLFADSMIKLSASEEPPATCNGKIAVWLQVIPAEDPSDENSEGIAGSTNLMVTCGVVNGDYEVTGTTNIVISTGVNIAPDTWHQVTIRTIKTIKSGEEVPGFVIWVDGKLAKAAVGAYVLPAVDGKGERFNDDHALFASASSDVEEAATLDSVGFSGSGALRRIDLLDAYNAPLFAVDPTYVHLTWDDKVTGVTIDGVELSNTVIEDKEYYYLVTNFTEAVSVALTLDPLYKVDTITPDTGIVSDIADDKKTFKFAGTQTFDDSQTITIATVVDRTEAEVTIDGGDATICNTLGQAFAAVRALASTKATVSIKLLDNAQSDNFGFDSSLQFKTMGIDLNGHSITGTCATGYVFSNVGGLTISDTSDTGAGKIVAVNGYAIWNKGSLIINDATGAAPIEFVGEINNDTETQDEEGEVVIYGGKFTSINTLTPSEFVTLPEGKVWSVKTDTDGYYTLVDAEKPTGAVIIIGADGQQKGDAYETLAAAILAAGEGDTVTLTANLTLPATLAIEKATAINLAGKTLTLSGDVTGIKISADSVVVTNGTIASALAANVSKSKAIDVSYANVTFKDLTINAGHYEYALYANCDEEAAKGGRTTEVAQLAWFYDQQTFKTLTCDNVTINGNGSLFHVEGMLATLNNCSAIQDSNTLFGASHHQAAVYSSVNAHTTITGSGTYTHVNALQSGNLGGKITVAEGSTAMFTGNIKSYMKMGAHSELESNPNYKAVFAFNAGTYTGSIVFDGADARTLDSFTKGTAVAITAPTGYTWLNDTTLTKGYTITWADSENIVVSNGTAQVGETSGSYAKGTVLKFYAMVGAITNVTVDGVTQEVANPFEYTVDEAAAAIIVLAGEDQPDTPWTPDEEAKIIEGNIPSDKADAVKANLDKIAAALGATTGGEAAAVEAWVANAYGQDGKIPVAKLAPATDAQIAVATLNDLPLTTAEPTFEVSASTVSADTNVAAFEFTLKDGSDAVEIKTLTAKVKAMVKYTEALGTTTPFAQAQENTDVTITLTTGDEGTAGKIKVELIKKTDVNAGFMKVEPQKPTPAGL